MNKININDNVTVKLTERGKKILYQDYPTLARFYHKRGDVFKFQLWEMMKIYGKYVDEMGLNQVFVDNVVFLNEKEVDEKHE